MKIHFLGTASNTIPIRDFRHQSTAIETDGSIYFFDAGDAVSRSVRFMNLDYLRINKIIISHPHMGHIGGLAYLLFMMRKEKIWQKRSPEFGPPDVYLPDMRIFEGCMNGILIGTEEGFSNFPINAAQYSDGIVFEDKYMKLTAYHNLHMGIPDDGIWRSYSFVIETEGKKLIYTGDISSYDEILPLIGDGCDVIFAETGRHDYREVCKTLRGRNIKNLIFTHNAPELVANTDAKMQIQELFDNNAMIATDRTSIILD